MISEVAPEREEAYPSFKFASPKDSKVPNIPVVKVDVFFSPYLPSIAYTGGEIADCAFSHSKQDTI